MDRSSEAQGLIIDMDGVLWRGETALPGLKPFFALLHQRAIPFILATNNASTSPGAVQEKLHKMGVEVEPKQILTSAQAAAKWLASRLPPGANVVAVGEDALWEALRTEGLHPRQDAAHAAAVVAGLDREFSYRKLNEALQAIRRGAIFVGTNPDTTFPTEGGLAPGAGSLLAAIRSASGSKPIIIGKPQPYLFSLALRILHIDRQYALVLGDRLETDILGAKRARLHSCLVLTGVTSHEDLARSKIHPDWVFDDLPHLMQALAETSS
jgi:4-nitrophenyl phosphatase